MAGCDKLEGYMFDHATGTIAHREYIEKLRVLRESGKSFPIDSRFNNVIHHQLLAATKSEAKDAYKKGMASARRTLSLLRQ